MYSPTYNKPDKSKNKTRQMGRKVYDAYRRFLNLEKRDEAVTTSYGSSLHTKGQFIKKEYLKTLIRD